MSTHVDSEPLTHERYCRVTVLGSRARVDAALATGQSIGSLLPEIAAMLDEPLGTYRMSLVTATGVLLSPDTTLAESAVDDGAVLQLLIEEHLPPPPIVNDITEEIAADLDNRPDRFGENSRRSFAVTLAAIGPAAITVQIWRAPVSHGPAEVYLSVAAAVLLPSTAVLARIQQRWWATITAIGAIAFASGALQLAADAHHWAVQDRIGMCLTLSWLGALLVCAILRSSGVAIGDIVGLLTTGIWWALGHIGMTTTEADAIVAVGVLIAIGTLPRWAAVASGLATLDDQRSAGNTIRRPVLRRTIGDAHQALVTSIVALGVLAGITGTLVGSDPEPWSIALATAASGTLLLRARAFPLTAEIVPMAAAGTAIAGSILLSWAARRDLAGPMAVTLGLTVLGTVALIWQPSAHLQVRLRQLGDRLEAVAVIVLIPSLLGIFGVYERLLHTF
jgi:type VII secretion integral membrane protein EccD